MPCRYIIDKQRRLVISIGWDRLTFAEMKAQQDELTNDPNFNPDFDQLVDTTAVTALDLSIDEAKVIASCKLYSPGSRRAMVATNPAIFGMGRLMDVYHSMATGRENVGAFYDRDSALKWLGLETMPDLIEAGEPKKASAVGAAKNDKIA